MAPGEIFSLFVLFFIIAGIGIVLSLLTAASLNRWMPARIDRPFPIRFLSAFLSPVTILPLAVIMAFILSGRPVAMFYGVWFSLFILYQLLVSLLKAWKPGMESFAGRLAGILASSPDRLLFSAFMFLLPRLQAFLYIQRLAPPSILGLTGFGFCLFLATLINLALASMAARLAGLVNRPGYFLKGASMDPGNLSYNRRVLFLSKKAGIDPGGLLRINNLLIPREEENKSFFIVGKPGTGKTLSLFNISESIRRRGEKMVIYDYKGDYISKFYDEKRDLLFNPLDSRSIKWNLFNEVTGSQTSQRFLIEAIAGAIIPDPEAGRSNGNETYFRNGAREVLVAILNFLRLEGRTTNEDIYRMLLLPAGALCSSLSKYETCIRAVNFLQPPGSPQAGGILSTLTEFTKIFNYIHDPVSDSFSIRSWLENREDKSTLFLQNRADMEEVLKPVLSLFISILARGILSLKDQPDRRIFLLLDEAGSLNPLKEIPMLLINGRSKGSSVFLAVQDFSQLDTLYGEAVRKTIVNACTTHLYFSVADSSSAQWVCDLIGEQEILEKSSSYSLGRGLGVFSLKRERKPALLSSEIMQMGAFRFLYRSNISRPFFSELNPEDFKLYPDRI